MVQVVTSKRQKKYYKRAYRKAPKRGANNSKMIVFKNPRAANAILPREYICTLRTRYSGSLAVIGMPAGVANFIVNINDCYRPFDLLPAANITWMNGVSPLALTAVDYSLLANVSTYEASIVLKARTRVWFNPSSTATNDNLIACITPTNTAAGASPSTVTQALRQPLMKFKEFHAQGSGPVPLSNTTDIATFLGMPRADLQNDVAGTYGQIYNAVAANRVFHVINVNTLDVLAPGVPIPFTIELEQLVKFYKFDAGQI